jgi:hypothetical protein
VTAIVNIRVVSGILGVVLAGFVGLLSLAAAVRPNNPDAALKLVPFDAIAQAQKADRLLADQGNAQALVESASLAKAAVRRDPTSATGVRVLALSALTNGDEAQADRLMAYARALSRRDLATTFYLINKAVADNKAAGALDNFDIALRTQPGAFETLFPILANALADDELVAPMAALFRKQPPWMTAFAGSAIHQTPVPINLARVLRMMPDSAASRHPVVRAELLARLVNEQRFSEAYAFYRSISGADTAPLLRDPKFARTSDLAPFEWTYPSQQSLGAEPQTSGGVRIYAVDARGVVARQMLLLAPGRYTLATITNGQMPSSRFARWDLRCADGDKATLGTLELTPAAAPQAFAVPASGCTAQWLSLVVDASGSQEDQSLTIKDVRVSRAGATLAKPTKSVKAG